MNAVRSTAVALTLAAILYQVYKTLTIRIDLGRGDQPIQCFNYSWERVRHEYLEGCESMRIVGEARSGYAASMSSTARTQWNSA